jgi:hypothetical protein
MRLFFVFLSDEEAEEGMEVATEEAMLPMELEEERPLYDREALIERYHVSLGRCG